MAFFSRAGSILRQTVSKHINHETSVTNPSIFQMIRCMSGGIPSSKVFVGGLAWATDDMSLREAFTAYGEVYEARVIMDRETGRSRGFGFVTFANSETASAAIQAMDQRELHGRTVSVHYANERPQFGGGGGRYGGGGGGDNYGGGRYGGGGDNYGGGRYGGGDSGYGQNSYGGDVSGNSGYGQNSYGGDVSGNGGYGGNNYGSGGDVAGSGGNWGNNYGSGGGENQNFGGGWNNGNANGNADGPVEGSYMDNDEPDEFAKRA